MLLSQLIGLLSIAANVGFAALDNRALRAAGVIRPFHWAWSFLQPTYMIGRPVVIRRAAGRASAPTLVYFAAYLLVIVVSVTVLAAAVAAAVGQFDPSSFGSGPSSDT